MINMSKPICRFCGESKTSMDFPRSKAPWFNGSIADICTKCLTERIDPRDLNSVNKWMQYLDVPFDPNVWIDTYEDNGDNAIEVYVLRFFATPNRPDRVDWSVVNQKWVEKMRNGRAEKEIKVMNEDWIERMKDKWGDYDLKEYERLESLYGDILRTQNITTSIQEDQVKKLCKISLIIDKKLQHGEDASKEMKTYGDTIKSAGLEPKNARNYGDFESVGELINFLVRKGYKPKFYDGKDRDQVDLAIHNTQAYLRRLVTNEPNLPDLVQQRRDSYKIAQQLDEEGVSDEELDAYELETQAVEFEDEGVDITDE